MNTTDIFSTQNTTTETADVGKIELDDDYKQLYIDIERWINSISFIALPVFGGFGNILTFIVMQRGSLKEVSTCFYISMLALADTGKYITEGCLNVFLCLCWLWLIQVNTLLVGTLVAIFAQPILIVFYWSF